MPEFGSYDPVAPLEQVPFQPWAAELFKQRQANKMRELFSVFCVCAHV